MPSVRSDAREAIDSVYAVAADCLCLSARLTQNTVHNLSAAQVFAYE